MVLIFILNGVTLKNSNNVARVSSMVEKQTKKSYVVSRGKICHRIMLNFNAYLIAYIYISQKAFRTSNALLNNKQWSVVLLEELPLLSIIKCLKLTLDCDVKVADSVIPCCVTCVVNDLMSSFVELVPGRNSMLRHIDCLARVISGNYWSPVYSGIVFRPVCIPFDVTTGTSTAKRGSFHI